MLAREEIVRRIDPKGRGHGSGLEVHGDGDPGLYLADEFFGAPGVEGEGPAHRDHQDVNLAQGGGLFLAELMAEIAEVADPDAVDLEAEYGVLAPELSLLLIVICGDPFKLDSCGGLFSGASDHGGVASQDFHVVMVVVVVADGDDVGPDSGEGVADALVEGVGDDDLPGVVLDLETGVAKPGYLQNDHLCRLLTSKDNNHSGGAVVLRRDHSILASRTAWSIPGEYFFTRAHLSIFIDRPARFAASARSSSSFWG